MLVNIVLIFITLLNESFSYNTTSMNSLFLRKPFKRITTDNIDYTTNNIISSTETIITSTISNNDDSDNIKNVTISLLMSEQDELPIYFELLKPSIQLAIDDIRHLYPNLNFILIARKDNNNCEANILGGIAAELYYRRNVNAFIGPICTKALDAVARLASYWNLPLMTAGGVGVEFSNKKTFKSLTRISFSLGKLIAYAHGTIFKKLLIKFLNLIVHSLPFFLEKKSN